MSDVLTLIDRQLQYKQEAAERYTGRARLAIKTDIETLKRAREEILRLEDLALSWRDRAEKVEVAFLNMKQSIELLQSVWEIDSDLINNLINNVDSAKEVALERLMPGRKNHNI